MRNTRSNHSLVALLVATGIAMAGLATDARADGASKALMHNWWDPLTVVGQTELHRSDDGLKANVKLNADFIDPDRAFTLWFIVFNTPEGCLSSPCTVADVFNPSANADFLYGGGITTPRNKAEFGGSLAVHDDTGSGFLEFDPPGPALGLTDPWNAEVMLAIHSHGPAGSGALLAWQISSFLGGCAEFLGPDGFAAGPEDIPDEAGECSTIMYAIHQP
jgi:hypothetical protein